MNNSIPQIGVEYFIKLIKLISDRQQSNRRTFKGLISKSDKTHAKELLNNLKTYIPEDNPFYPNYDEEDDEILVRLPPFYYFSLTEMLETYPILREELPKDIIYFEDIDYIFNSEVVITSYQEIDFVIIKNYIKCVTLYSLLKTQSDHSSKNSSNEETLYFLGKKKLSICNNLSIHEEDIINNLNSFNINYIESTVHKEAIKNIISDSLNSFYSEKLVTFNKICIDFDLIYEVIKNNYNIYISQFTFEKIKKEVEKFRTEAITRINKAFSDIQMQIITIPASLVVVASNLKTGQSFSFITNTIILLGAALFTYAVFLMCDNQHDTLNNIKHEIDAQEHEFTNDPLFANKIEITSNFEVLNTRFLRQKNNLNLVKKFTLASIILMVLIYLFILFDNTCLTINIPFLNDFSCV